MRQGVTDDLPEGNAWFALTIASTVHTGERFRQVSRGECQTYAVNLHHEIHRRTECTEATPAGTAWEQVGGQLMWISVGHGPVLWGVDYGNDVWYNQLGTPEICDPHCGTTPIWEEIPPTTMHSLDVGRDGHVWAVDRQW